MLALPLAERTWFVGEVKMITNDDLLKEVSLKELTELSDFEGIKEINQDIIDDALSECIAFISSYIKIPKNPTPLLKDITAKLVIIELKRRNNFPKEALNEQEERLTNLLLKMANKKIPTEIKDEYMTPKLVSRAFRHTGARMDLKDFNG
ncbi:phage protein Gp36 family protein [Campylobacter hyointestinalis]|uniref:phage protein Gp36 family protein n=1 Tax=Campylobacter hyointestinalis TaxID=198 RepID=UPI002156FBC0|nr:phage protein Gp36 family protein [Campylobacter hyointestinalis]